MKIIFVDDRRRGGLRYVNNLFGREFGRSRPGMYIVPCSLILPPPHIYGFDFLPKNRTLLFEGKCANVVHIILFLLCNVHPSSPSSRLKYYTVELELEPKRGENEGMGGKGEGEKKKGIGKRREEKKGEGKEKGFPFRFPKSGFF